MKKLTFVAVIFFMMISAGSLFSQDNQKAAAKAGDTKALVITPEKFQDIAEANVGKSVEIEGLVVHVCRHGGKKLFIVGSDPEQRVKITTSDKVSVFQPELEGSTIKVNGIIEPMAEDELPAEEKATQDADHTNYYHKPQFSITCLEFKTVSD